MQDPQDRAPGGAPAMTMVMDLPARLDLTAARPLARDIAAMPGDLMLDASAVRHLGGLCLQILIAARRERIRTGHGFALSAQSADFDAGLRLMGAEQALDCAPGTGP